MSTKERLSSPIILENHPQDSRVKIRHGTFQTLSGKMGTGGGNVPMILEPVFLESRQDNATITTDGTATAIPAAMGEGGGRIPMVTEVTDELSEPRNTILRILQETYGEETVCQWGVAIMAALQQAEVLQHGMHGEGIQGEGKTRNELDDDSLPCPQLVAEWMLREMRINEKCGCTPLGWQSTQQFVRELAKIVPELPHEGTQGCKDLFDLWSSCKGLWILQQALYQIQEVRRSVDGVWSEGGDGMNKSVGAVVRRLTPL